VAAARQELVAVTTRRDEKLARVFEKEGARMAKPPSKRAHLAARTKHDA
jgi:hypothetical protein